MPCCTWKCFPTAISSGVDISEVSRWHLLRQRSSQWGSQKLRQGLVLHELKAYLSLFDLFLTQLIMAILSKRCKPDNFESHKSLKLSLTNIIGLCSNFVECISFLTFWLYVRITWITQLILAISLWGVILFLIQNDYITHMHGLTVYVREGLPLVWDLSLKNSADSYVWNWLYFTHCLTSFSTINHLLCLYAQCLILFHQT